MTSLTVNNLVKNYESGIAVDHVNFEVRSGEFLTLLGPSGCGKSTTLAAIAGLDRPNRGMIKIGDTTVFDGERGLFLPAEARNCGLVFQSYALWPHFTVEQNVDFPLRLRKIGKPQRRKIIDETLALAEMSAYAKRYPHELSGGQQQRVALARTLAYQPSLLLLDEPLSNLDAQLRDRARLWLGDLQSRVRLTTIYVTHDQSEALALSDRIAVMNRGRIAQIGTPLEIYENPVDPFVADFIGTSSFLPGLVETWSHAARSATVLLADRSGLSVITDKPLTAGERVKVAVRPENIKLQDHGTPPGPERGTLLPAKIISRSYLGARYQYQIKIGGAVAKTETKEVFPKDEVWAWIPAAAGIVFQDQACRD